MQNFIYSGWVYLLVVWNTIMVLGVNPYSLLYSDAFGTILFACMGSFPWLIAALTSRDRKAWIRFLAVLSAQIAINALLQFFAVSMVDSEFFTSPLVSVVNWILMLLRLQKSR